MTFTPYAIGFIVGLALFALLPSLTGTSIFICFALATIAVLCGLRGLTYHWAEEWYNSAYEDVIECELDDEDGE